MKRKRTTGYKALYEKFKQRCLKSNYKIEEILGSKEIDEMLLISLIKPKLLN